jgi:hypothetical protein
LASPVAPMWWALSRASAKEVELSLTDERG